MDGEKTAFDELSTALVSIVVPAYNSENYLYSTVQSILSQSYLHWELLIVDDGSTDNTALIAKSLCEMDSRINYVVQENKGVSAARNTGAKDAAGDYVAFLDSDDLWHSHFLQELMCALVAEEEAVWAHSSFARFLDGTSVKKENPWLGCCSTGDFFLDSLVHVNVHVNSILLPKAVFESLDGFDESLPRAEDCDFILRLSKAYKGVSVPKELLYYRLRSNSLSTDWDSSLEDERSMLHKFWKDDTVPSSEVTLSKSAFYFKQAISCGLTGRRWGQALKFYCKAVAGAPMSLLRVRILAKKIFSRFSRKKTILPITHTTQHVSLVVATVGRVEPLELFFQSLLKQRYTNFSVVLADQNEPEVLDQLIKRYSDKINVVRVFVPQTGVSCARNSVLERIQGDIVAFPDDDCFYDSYTLENVANMFENNAACDVVFGSFLVPEQLDQEHQNGPSSALTALPINQYNVLKKGGTIVQFYRKNVVESVGGFDEELGPGATTLYECGEDTDYALRAMRGGYSIVRCPEVCVYHELPDPNSSHCAQKAYAYGTGRGYLLEKYGYSFAFRLLMCLHPLVMIFLNRELSVKCRVQSALGRFSFLCSRNKPYREKV